MTLLEREMSAQTGEGILRSDHCLQLGSITSLAPEATGGEILVAFWPKHGLTSDLRVPYFFWGSMQLIHAQVSAHSGCTSLKSLAPALCRGVNCFGPDQLHIHYFILDCHVIAAYRNLVNVLILNFFYRTYKLTD